MHALSVDTRLFGTLIYCQPRCRRTNRTVRRRQPLATLNFAMSFSSKVTRTTVRS
jgi:hypothetical protein